jgi:DNA repair photolyase
MAPPLIILLHRARKRLIIAACLFLKEGDSMLISASRRTDIPAFFSEWFLRRLEDKYVLVRNPMNFRQVSRIDLSPEVVDGIVLWTKNPVPMLDKLDRLKDYMYYFQFTLTAYGADTEPNVPSKNEVLTPAFQRLSDRLGPDRVLWRYDPIFLSNQYTVNYHADHFEKFAEKLEGYTKRCTISFMDDYRGMKNRMKELKPAELTAEKIDILAKLLSESACRHGMKIETCAENVDLVRYGIKHARCIDGRLFEKLTGCSLHIDKDKGQRPDCGCDGSIDIGAYNTCRNGCKYCYANSAENAVADNHAGYDPGAPMLCGSLGTEDKVTDRHVQSNKSGQLNLFD